MVAGNHFVVKLAVDVQVCELKPLIKYVFWRLRGFITKVELLGSGRIEQHVDRLRLGVHLVLLVLGYVESRWTVCHDAVFDG